jgi:GxxExxY protein
MPAFRPEAQSAALWNSSDGFAVDQASCLLWFIFLYAEEIAFCNLLLYSSRSEAPSSGRRQAGEQKMNHKGREGNDGRAEMAASAAIDAALKVHKTLGPGLLESAYEHCLAYELVERGMSVERQVVLPITYETTRLDAGYRLDLVIDHVVIIEIKAVEALSAVHQAQLLTYLKLSGIRLGLLMNFNVLLFKQRLKRVVN